MKLSNVSPTALTRKSKVSRAWLREIVKEIRNQREAVTRVAGQRDHARLEAAAGQGSFKDTFFDKDFSETFGKEGFFENFFGRFGRKKGK